MRGREMATLGDGFLALFDIHGEYELKGLRGKRTLFVLRRPDALDA